MSQQAIVPQTRSERRYVPQILSWYHGISGITMKKKPKVTLKYLPRARASFRDSLHWISQVILTLLLLRVEL